MTSIFNLLPKYVPKEGLDALKSYKYSAEDHSILKKLFLGRYWDFIATYLPHWMAPNLITLIGFLFLLSNFVISYYFCPTIVGCTDVPRWFFFYVVLSLFIYQTMDNIDGKQARRTNSSSPLGELFDHGCDSLFLLLTSFPFFAATSTDSFTSFLFLTEGVFAFYLSHWEEYHTGKLIMGTLANPTELQYFIMLVFALAGIFGTDYLQPTLYETLPLSVISKIKQFGDFDTILSQSLFFILLIIVGIGIFLFFFYVAYNSWRASLKNGHHIFYPLFSLMPQVIYTLLLILWIRWSKFDILNNHLSYLLCMHGLIFSYLCDQLMIARICKIPFKMLNPILIIPLLGALNVSPLFEQPIVSEVYAMPILFAILFVIYVYFIISVIIQFKNYLGINVFSISKKKTQ